MSLYLSPLVGLVPAAFLAGFIDAIAGGGGLITVPALLLSGLPAPIALGTNKGQSVFGAVSSFVTYLRQGGIDRKLAGPGFILGFLGSIVGALTVLALDPALLRPFVAVLLPVAATAVAIVRPKESGKALLPPIFRLLVALALGFYDGFFGPGTGTFLILLYVVLFAESMRSASANAKVVNLASNMAAVMIFTFRGSVRWDIAFPMALANALGAALGARLAWKRGTPFIRAIVVLVAFGVAIKVVVDAWRARHG